MPPAEAAAWIGELIFALLAAKAGENLQKVLAEDSIEGLVDVLYGSGKKQKCKQ